MFNIFCVALFLTHSIWEQVPNTVAPMVPVETDVDVSALLADRARFTDMLKGKLAEVRNRMKLYADKLQTER
jgi:hypothetical protein